MTRDHKTHANYHAVANKCAALEAQVDFPASNAFLLRVFVTLFIRMQVGLLRRQLEEAKNTSGSFEEGTERAHNRKSVAKEVAPHQSDIRAREELPLVNESEQLRQAERQDVSRRRPPSDTQSLTPTAFPSLLPF